MLKVLAEYLYFSLRSLCQRSANIRLMLRLISYNLTYLRPPNIRLGRSELLQDVVSSNGIKCTYFVSMYSFPQLNFVAGLRPHIGNMGSLTLEILACQLWIYGDLGLEQRHLPWGWGRQSFLPAVYGQCQVCRDHGKENRYKLYHVSFSPCLTILLFPPTLHHISVVKLLLKDHHIYLYIYLFPTNWQHYFERGWIPRYH